MKDRLVDTDNKDHVKIEVLFQTYFIVLLEKKHQSKTMHYIIIKNKLDYPKLILLFLFLLVFRFLYFYTLEFSLFLFPFSFMKHSFCLCNTIKEVL